jgi:hypothetical protein
MRQHYVDRKFTPKSLELIDKINEVLVKYQSQGYVLTVRQIFYQLVTVNAIKNSMRDYKNTASLLNDARLAGLVDWNMIEDRTRGFITYPYWQTPADFMDSMIPQYAIDPWEGQDRRVFVIIEKDALKGVVARTCRQYGVPLLAARGYPSVSVVREFGIDLQRYESVVIVHLGDHDPSGLDMTEDLSYRVNLFVENMTNVDLRRVALNYEQVKKKKLVPNPAKLTDARSKKYCVQFGRDSWELDALEPSYLNDLLVAQFEDVIDPDAWQQRQEEMQEGQDLLTKAKKKLGKL